MQSMTVMFDDSPVPKVPRREGQKIPPSTSKQLWKLFAFAVNFSYSGHVDMVTLLLFPVYFLFPETECLAEQYAPVTATDK